MTTFTDPAVSGTLTLQQLNDNFTYLGQMYAQWAAANPSITNYTPAFAVDPTGTKLQVTLNGIVVATLPMPTQRDAFTGPYTPGKSYVVNQTFGYNGSTYVVTTPFTATNFAGDAANYTVQQQGVVLPLPSNQVQDTTNNQTLDKTIVGLASALGKINAAISALQTLANANKTNVAAINTQLGKAGVTGFPLTLQ